MQIIGKEQQRSVLQDSKKMLLEETYLNFICTGIILEREFIQKQLFVRVRV